MEDLIGKRFAFGNRGSIQAGVLAYYFLEESGINLRRDLAEYTFHDEREQSALSDEMDVIERVRKGEYDAGAVCERTLEVMEERGELSRDVVRVFWSSPGYSHCCFTIHSDLDSETAQKITRAFTSVDGSEREGKAVLEGEACNSFVPGTPEGWEILEIAAERESLI